MILLDLLKFLFKEYANEHANFLETILIFAVIFVHDFFNLHFVPFPRMAQPNLPVNAEKDVKGLNHEHEMKKRLKMLQNFKFSYFPLGLEYFWGRLKTDF